MAEILEVIMIVSFGASWPLNVIKSYKARTTKGKSLAFLLLIFFGYIAGIVAKLVNADFMAEIAKKWYVLFFYVLNFLMVGADILLYVRNRRLDKQTASKIAQVASIDSQAESNADKSEATARAED